MTEHETQAMILDLIRLRGGVATRVNSGNAIFSRNGETQVIRGAEKGTSDIIACYKGQYIAIEVKHGKNKASQEQLLFGEDVKRSGGIFVIAYDLDAVIEVLDRIDKERR